MQIQVQNNIELEKATALINKIKKINKFNFIKDLTLILKYNIDDAGLWMIHGSRKEKNNIYVNPDNCTHELNQYGFTDDYSVTSTVIHEFSHFLIDKLTLDKKYVERFDKCFYLNTYSKEDRLEELTEITTLYIINPYLLKIIRKDIYDFLRENFKSPTKCSLNKFYSFWTNWSNSVKKLCKRKWKIWFVVNKKLMIKGQINGIYKKK